MPDNLEIFEYETNPLLKDIDLDGVLDIDEIKNLTNPSNPDTDYDRIPDYKDLENGSLASTPTATPLPITIGFSQESVTLQQFGLYPVYQINENLGQAVIDVVLSSPVSYEVKVDYTTQKYVDDPNPEITSGQLIFAPNKTKMSIIINIDRNSEAEPDKTILVVLKNPSAGVNIDTYQAELLILDDD